jgi:hypothetical protein
MSLLEEISSTLEAARIRHALIGEASLVAYGVNHASVDLDLFAASGRARGSRKRKRVPAYGPTCRLRRRWSVVRANGASNAAQLCCPVDGPLSTRNGFSSAHDGPLSTDDGSPSRDDENGTRSTVFRLRTTVRRLRTMNRRLRTMKRCLETTEMGRARRNFVRARRSFVHGRRFSGSRR